MKIKSNINHIITVSEEELDSIQLAIALMLENKDTHKHWHKALRPILDKMRAALAHGDEYEPI